MKTKITTLLRHALTAIPAGGAALLTQGWVTEAEAAQIDALQGELAVGLAMVLGGIAGRLMTLAIAKWLPGLAGLIGDAAAKGETENGGSGGASGGIVPSLLLLLAGVCAIGLLPSCSPAVIYSATTGAPIPATSVQRSGQPQATPIQVASSDLARAEIAAQEAERLGEPPPVLGLYDAGRAAEVAREVFTESSK